MSRCVLDASAILAVLLQEPGYETLTDAMLSDAVASTVNMSEVQARLVRRGVPGDEAWRAALSAVRDLVVFDEDQARIAGNLAAQTHSLGLSLGDRACLALGMVLKLPVYTADRNWRKLQLGIQVHIIR